MTQEKERVCKHCGKKMVEKEYNLKYLKGIKAWIYTCNCVERLKEKEEQEKMVRDLKVRVTKLFENANLPERCVTINGVMTLDRKYEIPEKSVYKEDLSGEVEVDLEYEKFHKYIANLPFNVASGRSLFIAGQAGTRKTSYACEIAKEAIKQGIEVKYFQVGEIVQKKISIWDIVDVPLLILDDLGMSKSEAYDGKMFTLLNVRIERGWATIIITNFTEERNRDIFGEPFTDRLKLFNRVGMFAESSRKNDDEL